MCIQLFSYLTMKFEIFLLFILIIIILNITIKYKILKKYALQSKLNYIVSKINIFLI